MGVVKAIAAFFSILIEQNLASESYEDGRIEVTADHRWVLTNIAEILSTDGVVCHFIETTDTKFDENGENTAKTTCKLRIMES